MALGASEQKGWSGVGGEDTAYAVTPTEAPAAEVKFVPAVTAGGSAKFLPAV